MLACNAHRYTSVTSRTKNTNILKFNALQRYTEKRAKKELRYRQKRREYGVARMNRATEPPKTKMTKIAATKLDAVIEKVAELVPAVCAIIKGSKTDDFDYLFHTRDESAIVKVKIVTARHVSKGWAKAEDKGSYIRVIAA
jgi:hypothetical protein